MKKLTENVYPEMRNALDHAGWFYLGCDIWNDPVTGDRRNTSNAYDIMMQRKNTKKPSNQKLILYCDYRALLTELRKQLKPHGLTIILGPKPSTRHDNDLITVDVQELKS